MVKIKLKTILALMFLILIMAKTGYAETVWKNDRFRLDLKNNELLIFHGQVRFLHIESFSFNFIKAEKIEPTEVIGDKIIFKLSFPQKDGFHPGFPGQVDLSVTCTDNTFHFSTRHESFRHITIKLKDQDEHYFGLIEKLYPDNNKTPDLRGQVVDVDVYAEGERNYAENYASAYSAFYMSSMGYGSFFDTFARGRYHLAIDGRTEIYHQTGTLNWYVLYGPTGDKIHKQYYKIIGDPKYIPIWACGPIFWRDQNNGGKDEILDDIQKFSSMKIPLTACWVDRPYSHGGHEWSRMNFTEKFKGPEKWIRIINEKYNMEFMTWVAPMTFQDKDFPGLLPGDKHYMDLTDPGALAEFEKRMKVNQYSAGVRGHKMDRADETFPVTAMWYDPVAESETRNKYAYLYSKVIHKFLQNACGKDQFNFARTAYHRTQPFLSALWGGDVRNNWQGMSGNMANAVRCGFMGFPVWGNDTGGYLGTGGIDEKLYIRWLQFSAWNGMFEVKIDGAGGSGPDRPPWKYSEQLQDIYRNVSNLRMKLLPYIYSSANTSGQYGVMMKPLAYMYPNDKNTYQIWDEFIFGNAFLVAPLFSETDSREVYFPEGRWYDFNDPAKVYDGPKPFKLEVPLGNIPVFIKENSIFVTGDIYRGNSKIWMGEGNGNESLSIHIYPGADGTGSSFTYMDYLNNDALVEMVLENQNDIVSFKSGALDIDCTIEVKNGRKPRKVILNGNNIEYVFDSSRKITTVTVKKSTAVNLVIVE
jgi:alpha-glucosidase (family GH31 glycosyl hydrolase)